MKELAATVFILVSAPLLGAIHFFVYGAVLGRHLYQLAGGITQHAWAIPLQMPGTFLLSCETLGSTGDKIGKALVLAASVGVGYSVASLAVALMSKQRRPLRTLDWRIVTIILGMIWVPVPETLAFLYYVTVKY